MDIDEVTGFTYSRHKLLQKLVTKQQLKKFFEENKGNIIEVRVNGKLVGTGFYLEFKDELHFISATVREGENGVGIILRAVKDKIKETGAKYVSWITPELKFKKWKVKGGKSCQTQ